MILEERTYTIRPGQIPALLGVYEREGYQAHRRHLGDPVGWFTSEFGLLNQIVHMWRFDSLDDRARRRLALYADPEWLAFLPKALSFIERQQNRILLPTNFSPMR